MGSIRSAALACIGALLCVPRAAAAALDVPAVSAVPPLDPAAPLAQWSDSAALTLTRDVAHAGPPAEATVVHVASDGRFLYVRFDAAQRTPIVATQHSNDVITGGSSGQNNSLAWSSDDAVWVDLWPAGAGGFEYQFEANPNGSHNESSSENAAFAPQWDSRGAPSAGGYTVTMAIPLGVIRGAHGGPWRAQFVRYVRATGAEDVWSSDALQTNPDDVSRSGALALDLAHPAGSALPPPRVAVYGLGALASAAGGGSATHAGADVSIPVTPAADIFATYRPDYSNVELDRQSIAPTVYQRVYTEVRPFFTQAASYYGTFSCNVCASYRSILYTPGIPTPLEGYAFEGKQGRFGVAAFDAIGAGRADEAGVVDYTSSDNRWHASFEHAGADLPGVVDDADEAGVTFSNLKHLNGYVNYSLDAGTNVTDLGQSQVLEGGGGWSSANVAVFGSLQRVGAQFDPVDGLVGHPGIAGYGLYAVRLWPFAARSPFASIGVSAYQDSYQGPFDGTAQSDAQVLVDLLSRRGFDVQVYGGSDYWRFGSVLTPVSQNAGFALTYRGGVQTGNAQAFPNHGTAATPTQIQYETGHYGDGILDTWLRTSTIRAGERGTVTFTLDDTAQRFAAAPSNVQWFDGVAYAYQIDRNSSLAVGLRRVTGLPPQPNGGGDCAGVCSNVSLAYHRRARTTEYYLAYGDPNALTTAPEAILKVIFYVGGQKGT
jgi:hypothetical protein